MMIINVIQKCTGPKVEPCRIPFLTVFVWEKKLLIAQVVSCWPFVLLFVDKIKHWPGLEVPAGVEGAVEENSGWMLLQIYLVTFYWHLKRWKVTCFCHI